MGMTDVNRAFTKGLGAKGTCSGGVMTYERDEATRLNTNRLTFYVSKPDGSLAEVTDVFPASADPATKAREMGEAFTGS